MSKIRRENEINEGNAPKFDDFEINNKGLSKLPYNDEPAPKRVPRKKSFGANSDYYLKLAEGRYGPGGRSVIKPKSGSNIGLYIIATLVLACIAVWCSKKEKSKSNNFNSNR